VGPFRTALTEAGFENVATYINSGNAWNTVLKLQELVNKAVG
jgi:uncharacterized protein (DUF1697 family)